MNLLNITTSQIDKQLAKTVYWRYVKHVHNGRWIEAPYLTTLLGVVQDFVEDRLYNTDGTKVQILCVSMPPQHGKSMSITETLPSWYLGKYPYHRVIEVSYNEDFARKFGRRNKEKITEYGKDLFGIGISKLTTAQDDWELDNNVGGMLSRGVGGSITGNPAHLIIIDDPVKNRKEANSEVYRDNVWDEWLNSIRTRLAAKGKTLVIMTRWHEDDLVGRMLANEGSRAMYFNLPCEAEEDDPIMREPGEPLGEILGKGKEWLKDFKPVYMTKEGSRVWESLYQGNPTAAEGNLFKRHWYRYYDVMPEKFDEMIQSWDCSFKDSDGSDFVAGTVWGRIGAEYYLLDLMCDRLDLPGTISAIIQMTAKWPRAGLKLIEDKANGPAVIQLLRRDVPGMVAVNPDGGKIARANAVSPAFEAGNVFFPTPELAPWIIDFENELSAFPSSTHDDRTDSLTQAINRFMYYTSHKEEEVPPKDHEEALRRRVDGHIQKLINANKRGGLTQV